MLILNKSQHWNNAMLAHISCVNYPHPSVILWKAFGTNMPFGKKDEEGQTSVTVFGLPFSEVFKISGV
jgi:hypothetical protein